MICCLCVLGLQIFFQYETWKHWEYFHPVVIPNEVGPSEETSLFKASVHVSSYSIVCVLLEDNTAYPVISLVDDNNIKIRMRIA
jgi:hypothetical protein